MTIPDTIPAAWLLDGPPACPSWCIEPTGHADPTEIVPGDWTRFHVAYRREVPTGGRPVAVEVAGHESWERGELATEPAGLTITYGEDLTQANAVRLLQVLTEATAVLSQIGGVQS